MSLPDCFLPADTADALPLYPVRKAHLAAFAAAQPAHVARSIEGSGYTAEPASLLVVPGPDGAPALAIAGITDPADPHALGAAPFGLPARAWRLAEAPGADALAVADARLSWGLGAYRFDRYRKAPRAPARLAIAEDAEAQALLEASVLARDLINTPTEHMGPDELEQQVRALAAAHGGEATAWTGDALLEANFPAIHAVGRASHRAPRLLCLRWGDAAHPHVAIVGKGVCFDTGGLDLKPADGMRNMKKDMGGAAHAIALAQAVMARGLELRITLLVAAVENAIGPEAFRPGEVIATRQGLSIEIDNTDAEGRLVLCDALTYAAEQAPALLLDFATLTGAARIALGPELPALYCNDEALAADYLAAAARTRDPLWRMPLWQPYMHYLKSAIADHANSGASRMAGSVTAALYLERFVPAGLPWAHSDVYSWNDADRPGRPAGGEAQGLRAAFALLKERAR